MLYAVWLFFDGSWQQTIINIDNKAPATGLSSGWYYGVGIFFSVSAAGLILRNLYQVVTGRSRKGPDPGPGIEDKPHAGQAGFQSPDAAAPLPATKG
jgi:TRAP-type C4-dicarboxylate transport system permease small subunit